MYVTRRTLCSTLVMAAGRTWLGAAQRTSPEGIISNDGLTATFSVTYARPLESVVYTFSKVYGWRITIEEAPLLYQDDIINVTRDPTVGIRALRPKEQSLSFSYTLSQDGGPPKNPEHALQTAIDAYNSADLPGVYKLLRDDEYFHIVPVAQRNRQRVNVTAINPFDMIITVSGANRYPESILNEVLESIGSLSGFPVILAASPFSMGNQPQIEKDFVNVSARNVLKELIRESGIPRVWYLLYAIRQKGYFLSII